MSFFFAVLLLNICTQIGLYFVYSHSMVTLQESKVPLSDILPQDLLVDILVERFQVGYVFSGYSSSVDLKYNKLQFT